VRYFKAFFYFKTQKLIYYASDCLLPCIYSFVKYILIDDPLSRMRLKCLFNGM